MTTSTTTRLAKLVGIGTLAASLFASLTACSADGTGQAAAPETSSTASVSAPDSAEEREALRTRLVRVINGDTIEVQPVNPQNGEPTGEPNLTVRMLGADAPEGDACGAAEAATHLDGLMRPNEPVQVMYEPELRQTIDEDGHTLAYVITGAGVTQELGIRMVREGYAEAAYPEGESVSKAFEQQNFTLYFQLAVYNKSGIWAVCSPQHPVEPYQPPTGP